MVVIYLVFTINTSQINFWCFLDNKMSIYDYRTCLLRLFSSPKIVWLHYQVTATNKTIKAMLSVLFKIIVVVQTSFPGTQSHFSLFMWTSRQWSKTEMMSPESWRHPHTFSPASGALKCLQTSKDFLLSSQSSCESYTKLFSVSWLSSLTETKRLSFFLTPPNSLKCHRNTFSWCWVEKQWQAWWLCFPVGYSHLEMYPLA